MSSRVDDLLRLAQLLDDGKISKREYEDLEAEILDSSRPSSPGQVGEPATGATSGDIDDDPTDVEQTAGEEATPRLGWTVFTEQPSNVYLGALTATSVVLLLSGAFGLLPWITAVLGVIALLATMVRGGRWVATVGAAMGVVFGLISLFPGPATLADAGGPLPASSPSNAEVEPDAPERSLGVGFAGLAEGWNALEQPPFIIRGFIKTPEPGPLDSFLYKFDDSALLAGAYNPSDDYVYALLAKASLHHESVSKMYLHLCYLIHPFSQECIDAYFNQGLAGGSLDEFVDVDHSATWQLEGNEWRLTITDNVQTIRVLAPEAG